MPLPSGTWSIATEVGLRDRNFTYCRPYIFDPLTTDDAFWHCLTLAVLSVGASCFEDRLCYQLVQTVLKIGCVLAIKVG